jgi:hypothetical protein
VLFDFALRYANRKSQEIERDWDRTGHISLWSVLKMLIYWAKHEYQKQKRGCVRHWQGS